MRFTARKRRRAFAAACRLTFAALPAWRSHLTPSAFLRRRPLALPPKLFRNSNNARTYVRRSCLHSALFSWPRLLSVPAYYLPSLLTIVYVMNDMDILRFKTPQPTNTSRFIPPRARCSNNASASTVCDSCSRYAKALTRTSLFTGLPLHWAFVFLSVTRTTRWVFLPPTMRHAFILGEPLHGGFNRLKFPPPTLCYLLLGRTLQPICQFFSATVHFRLASIVATFNSVPDDQTYCTFLLCTVTFPSPRRQLPTFLRFPHLTCFYFLPLYGLPICAASPHL